MISYDTSPFWGQTVESLLARISDSWILPCFIAMHIPRPGRGSEIYWLCCKYFVPCLFLLI